MSESFFEAIRDNILQQHLDDRTKVHLTLTSKEHANGKVQSGPYSDVKYGIPVHEFLKRSNCVQSVFESLAKKMDSAQNMNPAIGFNATLTFITYPGKEGKASARKKPGRLPFDTMHKKKDGMIKIDNSDELCCARAIVTMKEYVYGDPDQQYRNLRDGRPIQERLAKQLHREAGVKEERRTLWYSRTGKVSSLPYRSRQRGRLFQIHLRGKKMKLTTTGCEV